jgi:transposase-like protein
MSDKRKNQLSIAEPAEAVSVVGVQGQGVLGSTSGSESRRRRRVNKDEAREIGRLYAETSTPTSEIRERFGIGDSSLYRILQQQGVPLRGRTAARSQSKSVQARTPAAPRRSSSSADQAKQAISQRRPTKATTAARATRRVDGRSVRRPGRRTPVAAKTTSLGRPLVLRTGNDGQQFRIAFVGERVVRATSMHHALRQAKSFGAVEITAVSRVD